jgi:acyl-coenzyme A thioesterase PaaI-like protein
MEALQDRWLPGNACFGCGPANHRGLQLKSYPEGEQLVARWTAEPYHQGPPGVVQGAILAIPMDCHATWAAMVAFARHVGAEEPVPAVTAEYRMRLRRPTPTGRDVLLCATADVPDGKRVSVEVTAHVDDEVTAVFDGRFVGIFDYGGWENGD